MEKIKFQLASKKVPCSIWVYFRVLIRFKMDNSKEGGLVHRPTILDGAKDPPKTVAEDNYEDCEYQVEYDSKENIKFAKIFRKVMRIIEKRYGNNVPTNIKDNQHHNFNKCNFQQKGKDGEIQNLNYSYKGKGI